MNLPNKITMCRIFLSIVLLIMLVIPYEALKITVPDIAVGSTSVSIPLTYLIGGVIFLVASLTDTLDGYIARSRNLVTDFGKVMDAIADKVLVNGVLIVLACDNQLSPIVPVVIITRDIFVDSIKMVAGSKGKAVGASILGKIKTICMMCGLTLLFFQNIPFEFINIAGHSLDVASGLVYIAMILSIVSGIQYYSVNKEFFKEK